MLEIRSISAGYSNISAISSVDITVQEGQFVSILGPNGAGKSTLFKTISGTVAPMSGTIRFAGQDLLAISPSKRPALGIAHVPEGRQVFASMTVRENLETGAFTPEGKRNWASNIERIYGWFPRLKERGDQLAGTLSGGEQQMLAIGRGLASNPRLLMLDEPSMGLAPSVTDMIFDTLLDIRKQTGLTILLVEQRVAEALQFADHAYVLETGRVVLEGDHRALAADDRIRQAYLGM